MKQGSLHRLPAWWWLGVLVLALAKLTLVSQQEVVAQLFDDADNALNAANAHFASPYDFNTFSRPPMLSLFITLTNVLGVPLRLAFELGWIGAAALLGVALRAMGVRAGVALLCVAAVIFHPWTVPFFGRVLMDPLYAILHTALLASLLLALASPLRRCAAWSIVAGLLAGATALTRPEAVLVLVPIALAGGLALLMGAATRTHERAPWRARALRAALVTLLPLLGVAGLTLAAEQATKRAVGVAMTHDLRMPGLVRLYNTLLAIAPAPGAPAPHAQAPHAKLPVPRDVRERAYQASPSFATLRPMLEGQTLEIFAPLAKADTGAEGEHGAWAVWALRDATFRTLRDDAGNLSRSAPAFDAFYHRCADELREAMDQGRLPRRAVPLSMVAPNWSALARELPTSAAKYWRIFTQDPVPRVIAQDVPPDVRAALDAIALRRSALVAPPGSEAPPAQATTWWHTPRVRAVLDQTTDRLQALYNAVTRFVACWVPVVALLVLWVRWRRGLAPVGVVAILLLLLGVIIARLALVLLLGASGIWEQHRYVLAIAPLLHVALWVGLAGVVESLVRRERSVTQTSRV